MASSSSTGIGFGSRKSATLSPVGSSCVKRRRRASVRCFVSCWRISSQQRALRIGDRCSGETIEHLPRRADRVRRERFRIVPRWRSTPVQRPSYRQQSGSEPDEKARPTSWSRWKLSKKRGCDVPGVNLAVLPYSAALEHSSAQVRAPVALRSVRTREDRQQRVGASRAADLLPLLAEVGYGGKVHAVDRDEQPSRFTSRFTSRLVVDLPIHLPIRS